MSEQKMKSKSGVYKNKYISTSTTRIFSLQNRRASDEEVVYERLTNVPTIK
jgi:hypothetical protein